MSRWSRWSAAALSAACWYQMGSSECFRNCWPQRIFPHKHLQFTDEGPTQKTCNKQQFSGRKKNFVDDGGQRRTTRLIQVDNETAVIQITTCYKQGLQRSASKHTRDHWVLLLAVRNRKPGQQIVWTQQNWTIENWKTLPGVSMSAATFEW